MHSSAPVHVQRQQVQPLGAFASLCGLPLCRPQKHMRKQVAQVRQHKSTLLHCLDSLKYVLLTPAGYDNASKTKQYDAEAIQYTSYLVYPLVACYAVYALIYKTHKSWYSWLLSSLVGAVYSFGFIMMVPQASTAVQAGCNAVQPARVSAEACLPHWQYG